MNILPAFAGVGQEMNVAIDEARHQGFAVKVVRRHISRYLDLVCGANLNDFTILNQDCSLGYRWLPCPVDQPDVF